MAELTVTAYCGLLLQSGMRDHSREPCEDVAIFGCDCPCHDGRTPFTDPFGAQREGDA